MKLNGFEEEDMKIRAFDENTKGEKATLYSFENAKGAVMEVSDFGATLVSLMVPDKDGNLLIDVALPNGLLTSYNKQIVFQQEMKGSAEIVTEDLRLIERILYQFKSIFEQV